MRLFPVHKGNAANEQSNGGGDRHADQQRDAKLERIAGSLIVRSNVSHAN